MMSHETNTQLPVAEAQPVKRRPPAAGMGRVKGSPNRMTRVLKDAILAAAEAAGQDGKGKNGLHGYLVRLAIKEPRSFASLLGRVMPLQIVGDPDAPLSHVHTIRLVSVAPDPERVKRLEAGDVVDAG